MKTKYKVIQVDGTITEGSVEWPKEPDFAQIKTLVEPLIQTPGKPYAYLEHVRVWREGSYRSMFVDDMAYVRKLEVNKLATKTAYSDGEGVLEVLRGPVVLFSRNVWF